MLTERQIYQGVYFSTTNNGIIHRVIDPETAKTILNLLILMEIFSGNFYLGYGIKIKKNRCKSLP
jgi:hypothetical protein